MSLYNNNDTYTREMIFSLEEALNAYSKSRQGTKNGLVADVDVECNLFAPPLSYMSELFFSRILIVSDSNDASKLLEQTIKQYLPFKIEVVMNGEEAVEKCRQNKYGIVVMNMQESIMNGYMIARLIREEETLSRKGRIPIIAVEGSRFEDAEEILEDAGCDEYLYKPVSQTLLLNLILRMIAE